MGIRKSVALLLAVIVLAFVSGCVSNSKGVATEGKQPASENKKVFLNIGSAPSGGAWYAQGVALAKIFNQYGPGVNATAEETGGGIENARLLSNGDVNVALVNGDAAVKASAGQPPFESKLGNMTVGWGLVSNPLHLVARKDSNIKDITELMGKKVNLGAAGSAGQSALITILAVHGIKETDFTAAHLGWAQAVDPLVDGQLDVTMIIGAAPAPAIEAMTARTDVAFVEFSQEGLQPVIKQGLVVDTIPAGTYKNQTSDLKLPAFKPYVFFAPELSTDLVYELTKVVVAKAEELKQLQPNLVLSMPNEEEAGIMGYPIHPGVVKYMKEAK